MGLKLITAPASQPITLAEVKLHLNIDDDDWDTLLAIYIKAATAYVDGPQGFLGQALVKQTWDLFLDEFPDDAIRIPLGPLIEVVGVFYSTTSGELTVSSDDYTLDTAQDFPWILPDEGFTWPTPQDGANTVRVRFRSGYVDDGPSPNDGTIPDDIKAALLLIVGDFYMNRETQIIGTSAMTIPWSAEQLMRQHRKQVPLA